MHVLRERRAAGDQELDAAAESSVNRPEEELAEVDVLPVPERAVRGHQRADPCSTMAGLAVSSWVIFRWKSVHSAGTPIIAVTWPDSSTSPRRSVVSSSR
jgi:hypothetical protein